jgi:hypothetical protein
MEFGGALNSGIKTTYWAPAKLYPVPSLRTNGLAIALLLTEGVGRSHVIRVTASQIPENVSWIPGKQNSSPYEGELQT